MSRIHVIGGGLAGCEVAYALSRYGLEVDLYEMRPARKTPAHKTEFLAELVCSNSLRSNSTTNAVGILKREMMALGSLVMEAALQAQIPAGDALAVDREVFSRHITDTIKASPRIRLHRREVTDFREFGAEDMIVMATGPLTSPALYEALKPEIGPHHLYFYDAISPIIDASTLDMDQVFAQSRYGKGGGEDYLNCPLTEEAYFHFVRQLRNAQRVLLKPFEKEIFFEGCLPIEVMADRGDLTLAYGPMKPVGLTDPRTGKQPFAVVQLRRENQEGSSLNMVGFQTKMTYAEQKRVLRLIPGLEKAEFYRLGSIHRNTFIDSPRLLDQAFRLRSRQQIRFTGQMTGTEGYVESAALGLLVGLMVAHEKMDRPLAPPPPTTALGAMVRYLTGGAREDFQPTNIHFGLFEDVASGSKRLRKAERKDAYGLRAKEDLLAWMKGLKMQHASLSSGPAEMGLGLST